MAEALTGSRGNWKGAKRESGVLVSLSEARKKWDEAKVTDALIFADNFLAQMDPPRNNTEKNYSWLRSTMYSSLPHWQTICFLLTGNKSNWNGAKLKAGLEIS
ncbi:MAG: hypothetical protein HN929_02035 [Chloroflexi bacterium]|nr:hypothetical protein [Chloroflexota bacterium]